jgi:hypothetical protein
MYVTGSFCSMIGGGEERGEGRYKDTPYIMIPIAIPIPYGMIVALYNVIVQYYRTWKLQMLNR